MKNKIYLIFMLGVTLALGLLLIGCPDPTQSEAKPWTKVINVNEIIGSWEGTLVIPIPADKEAEPPLPASSIDTKLTMTVTDISFTEEITMDMNKYLTDMVGSAGKSIAWKYIKDNIPTEEFEEDDMIMTMEALDDYKLVITASAPISLMDFTEEDSEYMPYINAEGTKIKIVLPADLNPYGKGDVNFILNKK